MEQWDELERQPNLVKHGTKRTGLDDTETTSCYPSVKQEEAIQYQLEHIPNSAWLYNKGPHTRSNIKRVLGSNPSGIPIVTLKNVSEVVDQPSPWPSLSFASGWTAWKGSNRNTRPNQCLLLSLIRYEII